MELLRNQFLGLFFRLCCLFLFILNLPFFYYFLYFYCPLSFKVFFFYFSFFFCFFSSHLFSLSPFLFSSFSFYHPGFSSFSLHYFPHFSEYLLIFTFSILQSISGLLHTSNFQSHFLLLFSNHINFCYFSMPLIINIYLYYMLNQSLLVEKTIYISYINWSFYFP